MSSLLPQHHEEFRKKEYWEHFFRERGQEAFEWYGTFDDVSNLILRVTKKTDICLIIGCGNSEFSSELYDNGYHNVINIDFSPLVIEEMISKNINRPIMQWQIMDMTELKFPDNKFDLIFDKGALDALMSENTNQIKEKANSLFDHIYRTLKPGGKYILITLAENYILEHFINYFTNINKCHIKIDLIKSTKKSNGPLQPFFITFTKPHQMISQSLIFINFDQYSNILQKPIISSSSELLQKMKDLQLFNQQKYTYAQLEPGRFDTLNLYSNIVSCDIPRFTINIVDTYNEDSYQPKRYCAVLLVPRGREAEYQFAAEGGLRELAKQADTRRLISVSCNRPHDFPPMTELQAELSPVAMSLRPYSMPEEELIPYLAVGEDEGWIELTRGDSTMSGQYIIEESVDSIDRNDQHILKRRLLFLNNQQLIQSEVRLLPDPANNKKHQTNNKSNKSKAKKKLTTTSSATMNSTSSATYIDECNSVSKLGYKMDLNYIESHHIAILASLILSPALMATVTQSNNNKTSTSIPSTSFLLIGLGGGVFPMCLQKYLKFTHFTVIEIEGVMEQVAEQYFGFQKNKLMEVIIADGIEYFNKTSQCLEKKKEEEEDVTLIDTTTTGNSNDTQLIPLSPPPPPTTSNTSTAMSSSEITTTNANSTLIGSNLKSCLWDVICIDADSKDLTTGMSAPPAAFVTLTTLATIHSLLQPTGLLIINIAARSVTKMREVEDAVRQVFCRNLDSSTSSSTSSNNGNSSGSNNTTKLTDISTAKGAAASRTSASNTAIVQGGKLFKLVASAECINIILIAIKGGGTTTTCSSNSSSTMKDRNAVLFNWLQTIGLPLDPLGISEMLKNIIEI